MTVYLVMHYYHDDVEVCGVYKTQEAAQGYIDQQSVSEKAFLEIEEWEVED